MERPRCGKCGDTMTPEDSKIHPEYFLHDRCLPEELIPKGDTTLSYQVWRNIVGNEWYVQNKGKPVARFYGTNAEKLATDYAAWMNAGCPMLAPIDEAVALNIKKGV